eukprot:gnl/TRDRNA2_/TRDRNA2_157194_c1_seq1.p1 gnl/TRDRNA2_/TRDRNA2_157194_c1~~gnl/TRDRNA2_/TRDRNA2_157194_c1_seq1.p1  ORF type:complete len:362 (-),score=35.72 gnl/TRDRNA2_/TRDRNA2_157194_c1_seq1:12-950(-)
MEGAALPAMYQLLAVWAPDPIRTRMTALTCCGAQFGILVALPLTGAVIGSKSWLGYWPVPFFLFGGIGLLWVPAWLILTPTKAAVCEQGTVGEIRETVDWRVLLSDRRPWGCYAAHFANSWTAYVVMILLPTYLDQELRVPMAKGGLMQLFPYAAYICAMTVSASYADFLLSRGVSVVTVRRIFTCAPLLLSGVSLVLIGYVRSKLVVVALMALCLFNLGCNSSGCMTYYLEIFRTPAFTSAVFATGNTIANTAGILSPLLDPATEMGWKRVFCISLAINVVGASAFALLTRDTNLSESSTVAMVTADPCSS